VGSYDHWVSLLLFLDPKIVSLMPLRKALQTLSSKYLIGASAQDQAIDKYPFSDGGFFKARLSFPPEFPLLPPKMRFITEMWHPNSTWDALSILEIIY
jgi:hypothetical protein